MLFLIIYILMAIAWGMYRGAMYATKATSIRDVLFITGLAALLFPFSVYWSIRYRTF